MFSGLFTKPEVDIIIDEVPGRKRAKIYEINGQITRLPLLYDKEDVSGRVLVKIPQGKTFEHKGIKIELLGVIQSITDASDSLKFISLTSELESMQILSKETNTYTFKFTSVQKQYETYRGKLRNIMYLLRLTIDTSFRSLTYDQEFAVYNFQPETILGEDNLPIKLEVGIEDWLQLVLEIDARKYDIKGVLVGRVTFKKVSIRLTSMEVQIMKKETYNVQGVEPISQVIIAYEIMDGGPIKNEIIPIRFYLRPYDFTPSIENANNRLSVTYMVSLVLVDIENRKYFKRHEITFYRIEKKKIEVKSEEKK